ncbi:MAG: hypothetical protein M3010_04035, partial [Candidatus Dormibacteraeota bacterium]|nr:hypothetical protein [Candidatus Dormibacteraeota bacterium]
ADVGVRGASDLTARVHRGMEAPRRHWARWAIAAALSLPIATGTGLAVSTGQVHIHWDHGSAPADNGKAVTVQRQMPFRTTTTEAERQLGFHVQTLSGYAPAQLKEVTFIPPIIAINGKTNPHSTGAVDLVYTVSGTRVEVVEQLDPAGPGPLDVTLKQPGLLDRPPAAAPTVQSFRGQDYLVFLIRDRVASVHWKPAQGAVMMIINYGLSGGSSPRAEGPTLQGSWDLIAHLS